MGTDLLSGSIPSSTEGTDNKSKFSTKRLNKKPLAIALVFLLFVSALIMISLNGMAKNKGIAGSADDNFKPMPTNSFVDDFLMNRPDGVIGQDEVIETSEPEFLSNDLYTTPLPPLAVDEGEEPVLPLPVPVEPEVVAEIDPYLAEIEEMMRKQMMQDIMAKHNGELEAMKAPTQVRFEPSSKVAEAPKSREEQADETAKLLDSQRAKLTGAEDRLNTVMKMVEMRMAADPGLAENPEQINPNAGQSVVGGGGGAGVSRGMIRPRPKQVARRQTTIQRQNLPESVIQQEDIRDRVPLDLKNEFLLRQRQADSNYLAHSRLAPITDSEIQACLLYTSPSPRDATLSRMPSSA